MSRRIARWITFILGTLVAIGTIIGFVRTCGPEVPLVKYVGRVTDVETSKPIKDAKVTLDIQGAPSVLYADSEGRFRFSLKGLPPDARIRVEANGYDVYDLNVTLRRDNPEIDIRLKPSPNTTSTPAPAPTPPPSSLPPSMSPKWEQNSVTFDPALSLPFMGGNVRVGIATNHGLASGSTVSAVSFRITGPGFDQMQAGSQVASAAHPEGTPPYLSLAWATTFTVPVNNSGATQTFTVTASSPVISVTRLASFTVTPTPTPTPNALYFSGAGGVTVDNPANFVFGTGDSITIELWVKLAQLKNYTRFVYKGGTPNSNYSTFSFGTGDSGDPSRQMLMLGFWDTNDNGEGVRSNSPVLLETNRWYHVAAAFTYGDTSSGMLYVDGNRVPSTWEYWGASANPNAILVLTPDRVTIGSLIVDGVGQGKLAGAIEELRIWKVKRTDAQIAQNYTRVLSAQAGLIGLWHGDEGQGQALNDSSGWGNTGHLGSEVTWGAGKLLTK